MNLYLVHCGFYDELAGSGIYEIHTNLFVVAESFDDAKAKAKQLPEFKKMRMHVDGMQEILKVDGFEIRPTSSGTDTETVVNGKRSTFGFANLKRKKTS